MKNNNISVQKWSVSSRIFHWIIALLLVITSILMLLYGLDENKTYLSLHKAFGMSIVFWMIARVINRVMTKAPAPIPMPKIQMIVSQLTHFLLYALLIAMPIAGLLMSVYGGRPVDMFGLLEIPVFVTPSRSSARFYNDVHTDILWPMIVVFTLAHIGAAFFHQWIKKDKLIDRMK